ncbi:MAG: hypothetical protein HYR85_10640 [Planctomycetes bacterium]|nr:hypothetical protein [Planctomycetota bacterium]MBI3847997.1 hypothetical protein [Planctomycetota bacterium]
MKRRNALRLAGLFVVAGLGVGCQSDGPCRSGWVGRPETGPWPNFTDSKHFLGIAFGGNLDSLNRTLDSIAQSTRCDVENFPGALERFWLLIR